MAVPNTRAAVGVDASPHAIGTTKGANPIRVFQAGAPGADVSVCWYVDIAAGKWYRSLGA